MTRPIGNDVALSAGKPASLKVKTATAARSVLNGSRFFQEHGGSWKQAFFEKTVSRRIASFDASTESIAELQRLLAYSKKYIRRLEIDKLPSHLNLELVFDHLGHGPTSLVLKYGPGEVGMKYERTLFGMKLSDSR